MHGFLALRSLDGKRLADGEMTQIAEGDRVTSRLIFRFKDGSVYVAAQASRTASM
jgi:DNA-binding IclR family transcriptional regulator